MPRSSGGSSSAGSDRGSSSSASTTDDGPPDANDLRGRAFDFQLGAGGRYFADGRWPAHKLNCAAWAVMTDDEKKPYNDRAAERNREAPTVREGAQAQAAKEAAEDAAAAGEGGTARKRCRRAAGRKPAPAIRGPPSSP